MLYSMTEFVYFILNVQAHVFKAKSGACAAFLANYNPKSYATVAFGSMHYNLPPWSISILPDCKHTIYNTARVRKRKNIYFSRLTMISVICNEDLGYIRAWPSTCG